MIAPGEVEAPRPATSWRAIAILLLLAIFGLPSESFRDLALSHDPYFDTLDQRSAIVVEARRSTPGEPDTGAETPSDEPSLALPWRVVDPIALEAVSDKSNTPRLRTGARLVPEATGPPSA